MRGTAQSTFLPQVLLTITVFCWSGTAFWGALLCILAFPEHGAFALHLSTSQIRRAFRGCLAAFAMYTLCSVVLSSMAVYLRRKRSDDKEGYAASGDAYGEDADVRTPMLQDVYI